MSGHHIPLPSRRYVVTELEGLPIKPDAGRLSTRTQPGLSVHIVDTLAARRIVWTRRSEEFGHPNTDRTKDFLRYEAEREAARLNGEPEPPTFTRWRSHFRPTCPKCGNLADERAAYCRSCGANLYRQERNGKRAPL